MFKERKHGRKKRLWIHIWAGTGENYLGLELSNASSYGNNECVKLEDIHKVTYKLCYIDFVVKERIYLITEYPKNKKENLSKEECNEIKKLVKLLEESLYPNVSNKFQRKSHVTLNGIMILIFMNSQLFHLKLF